MPLVGIGLAGFCTSVSAIGVLFLFAIGIAFEKHAHVLMGSVDSPEHGTRVARVCFASAIFYAIMLAFCSCQLRANRRVVRGGSLQLQ
ncbi:hypothetical protein CROQUDRAFT_652720 [Cronartium quercuum f. sp. fusiforme G11]|uniref:Uncharacterized protein n=1 Tax=Cronartium quercuum f. sp. fusiforme G11 TaxID=708437 RepID=A0A9P6TF50_9BASI|nr:hypothetical protein CROQUDRAFT_652720 [Cronartium quercuum f. sp. fusiforme G11]